MKKRRLVALMLSLLLVLTMIPVTVFAEGEVYGISDGYSYYECDSTGYSEYGKMIDPNTITHLFIDSNVGYISPLGLSDKTKLESVTFLSGGSVYLDSFAFAGYENLKNVVLNDSVSEIGYRVFMDTALTTMTISSDISNMDDGAFKGCDTLSSVVNQSSKDYTVEIHGVNRTITAGTTWTAGFEISTAVIELEKDVHANYQLSVVGVDGSETVTWALDVGESLPDGLSLSADGVISGTPTVITGESFDVVASTTSDTIQKTITIYVEEIDKYDVILDDTNVNITSGSVGTDAIRYEEDYILGLSPKNTDKIIYGFEFDMGGSEWHPNYTFFADKLVITGTNNYVSGDITITPVLADTVEGAIAAATKVTVPYSGSLIHSEYVYFDDYLDGYKTVSYAIDLAAGEMVNISHYGTDDINVDTLLALYKLDSGTAVLIDRCDDDAIGYGEEYSYMATEAGTYYVFCMAYVSDAGAPCTVEFEIAEPPYNIPANPTVNGQLDLTDDTTDTSDAAGLWSWDVDTKTLTLHDGFALISDSEGIILPAGATVIVEGKAEILSEYNGIWTEEGDLDIQLKAGASLEIASIYENGIWAKNGDITITGEADSKDNLPKLDIYAYEEGILTGDEYNWLPGGSITITSCDIDIQAEEDGIQATDGSLTITDSKVKIISDSDALLVECYSDINPENKLTLTDCDIYIEAYDEGIQSYHGDIVITDCDTYIDTTADEEGIYLDGDGDIIVTGGRLVVLSYEESIENYCGTVSLTDVNYYLYSEYADIIKMSDTEGFALGGKFKIIDENGEVIYEGEWSENLIYEDEEGNYCVRVDVEGEIVTPMYIISVVGEDSENDIALTGLKDRYNKGEDVTFTAVTGVDPLPVDGTVGWVPVEWMIEGQEFAKTFGDEPYTGTASTEELATGEHTLLVAYVKVGYAMYDGWYMLLDGNQEPFVKILSHTFEVVEPVQETTEATTEATTGATETTTVATEEATTATPTAGVGGTPSTGDTNNSMLWIVLAFISVAGVFTAVAYGKSAKRS